MDTVTNELSPDEKTKLLMELGYFIDVDMEIWTGTVTITAPDLNLTSNTLPVGHQNIQLMSKPWIKKVTLTKESVKKGSWQYTYFMPFGEKSRRYVFASAVPVVIKNLEHHSKKFRKFFDEAADNMGETRRLARQILSKNAEYIWRAVQHLVKDKPLDPTKVPDKWKAHVMDNLMNKRFPSEAKLRKCGMYYTIYRPDTAGVPVGGRFQRYAPGTITDTIGIATDLLAFPEFMSTRLQLRMKGLAKNVNEAKSAQFTYPVHLKLLRRDLEVWPAFNPVLINGYGLNEKLDALRLKTDPLSDKLIRNDEALRLSIVNDVFELYKIVVGPWAAERDQTYRRLFGPPKE